MSNMQVEFGPELKGKSTVSFSYSNINSDTTYEVVLGESKYLNLNRIDEINVIEGGTKTRNLIQTNTDFTYFEKDVLRMVYTNLPRSMKNLFFRSLNVDVIKALSKNIFTGYDLPGNYSVFVDEFGNVIALRINYNTLGYGYTDWFFPGCEDFRDELYTFERYLKSKSKKEYDKFITSLNKETREEYM